MRETASYSTRIQYIFDDKCPVRLLDFLKEAVARQRYLVGSHPNKSAWEDLTGMTVLPIKVRGTIIQHRLPGNNQRHNVTEISNSVVGSWSRGTTPSAGHLSGGHRCSVLHEAWHPEAG
jgi:hypothetical protein